VNASSTIQWMKASQTVTSGKGTIIMEIRLNMVAPPQNATDQIAFGLYSSFIASASTVINAVYASAIRPTGTTPNNSWQLQTSTTTASTITPASSTWVGNTWYKIRLTINSSGSLVTLAVNDVNVATSITNIPTTTSTLFPFFYVIRGAGATAVTLRYDYFTFYQVLTSSR
jgi:hypothetical protein